MVCHIFWPKAKRSKAAHGKRPQEQERAAVEDLNGRCLASVRDEEGIRLSRRRHSCTEGRPWVRIGSGVARRYSANGLDSCVIVLGNEFSGLRSVHSVPSETHRGGNSRHRAEICLL